MLDPTLLRRFKHLTREDEQVAKIIIDSVDLTNVHSILDVEAGSDGIANAVRNIAPAKPSLAVVEPELEYTYTANVHVIRERWENVVLRERYDLILMSHVIGHFDEHGRVNRVGRAVANLSAKGVLIVVENAPYDPYWTLNTKIAKIQTSQYLVDFTDLESAFARERAIVHRVDHVIPLYLGSELSNQIKCLTFYFPRGLATLRRH